MMSKYIAGIAIFAALVMACELTAGNSIGVPVGTLESQQITGGGDCKDWVNEACSRPGETTCSNRCCLRWTTDNPSGYQCSQYYWCCSANSPCGSKATILDPCVPD